MNLWPSSIHVLCQCHLDNYLHCDPFSFWVCCYVCGRWHVSVKMACASLGVRQDKHSLNTLDHLSLHPFPSPLLFLYLLKACCLLCVLHSLSNALESKQNASKAPFPGFVQVSWHQEKGSSLHCTPLSLDAWTMNSTKHLILTEDRVVKIAEPLPHSSMCQSQSSKSLDFFPHCGSNRHNHKATLNCAKYACKW